MLKTLLRLRMEAAFSFLTEGKGSAKPSKGRKIAMIAVWAYLALTFISMSFSVGVSLGTVCVGFGLDFLFFALFFIVAFSVLLLLGILEAKSMLFEAKDNAVLFPLPISPRDIFLSRIITLLIFNYAEAAIALVPAFIAYLAVGGAPFATLGFLLVFLLLPLLATAISALIGFVWSYIGRRIPSNPFVGVAVCVVCLGVYFVGYSRLISGFEQLILDIESAPALVQTRFAVLRVFGNLAFLSPVPTVVFVLLCALVSVGTYLLFSRKYLAFATMTAKVKPHYKQSAAHSRISTPLMAIVRKELGRFTSSSLYMLNAGLGLVFELLLSVSLLFKGDSLVATLSVLFGLDGDAVCILILAALLAVIPMTYPSAASVSLEGKSFWILRSLPVSDRDILLGKMLPQCLIGAPVHLMASLLLSIALRPSPLLTAAVFLLPQIAAIGWSAFGVLCNLLFPKLSFTHETQVIKQSLSIVLASIVPTVILMGLLGLMIYLGMQGMAVLALVLLSALSCLLSALFCALLFTVGRTLLAKIR